MLHQLLHLIDNGRWRDGIPDPPSGHGVGFGKGKSGYGPSGHSLKRSDTDVLMPVKKNMFIGLIRQNQKIFFHRHLSDGPQDFIIKDGAGGIGGAVDDYQLGFVCDGSPDIVRIYF